METPNEVASPFDGFADALESTADAMDSTRAEVEKYTEFMREVMQKHEIINLAGMKQIDPTKLVTYTMIQQSAHAGDEVIIVTNGGTYQGTALHFELVDEEGGCVYLSATLLKDTFKFSPQGFAGTTSLADEMSESCSVSPSVSPSTSPSPSASPPAWSPSPDWWLPSPSPPEEEPEDPVDEWDQVEV